MAKRKPYRLSIHEKNGVSILLFVVWVRINEPPFPSNIPFHFDNLVKRKRKQRMKITSHSKCSAHSARAECNWKSYWIGRPSSAPCRSETMISQFAWNWNEWKGNPPNPINNISFGSILNSVRLRVCNGFGQWKCLKREIRGENWMRIRFSIVRPKLVIASEFTFFFSSSSILSAACRIKPSAKYKCRLRRNANPASIAIVNGARLAFPYFGAILLHSLCGSCSDGRHVKKIKIQIRSILLTFNEVGCRTLPSIRCFIKSMPSVFTLDDAVAFNFFFTIFLCDSSKRKIALRWPLFETPWIVCGDKERESVSNFHNFGDYRRYKFSFFQWP